MNDPIDEQVIKDQTNLAEAINFHLTSQCNYRCKFCFAKYQNCTSALGLIEAKQIISELAMNGCKKINFAGGEPTLIPYLPDLICHAKEQGLFVSLISNGTGITQYLLDECMNSLDLIGLSIDSQYNEIEYKLGRTLIGNQDPQKYSHVNLIKDRVNLIHDQAIYLKINTTITPLNWNENMIEFIRELTPQRWKIFQVQKIQASNHKFFEEFGPVSNHQFQYFFKVHQALSPIAETADLMLESYAMITPDGRFYQNTGNQYHYSQPILKHGLMKAFHQVQHKNDKYLKRHGNYFYQLERLKRMGSIY